MVCFFMWKCINMVRAWDEVWSLCHLASGTRLYLTFTQMWFVFHLRGDYWRMVQQQHLILLLIIMTLLWPSVILSVSYFVWHFFVYLFSHAAFACFVLLNKSSASCASIIVACFRTAWPFFLLQDLITSQY